MLSARKCVEPNSNGNTHAAGEGSGGKRVKRAHAAHKHPDEELIIIKEGTVEALVNGETHRLGPGSVIFQAANQMHTLRNVGDTPAVYHVIRWNSPGMLHPRAD